MRINNLLTHLFDLKNKIVVVTGATGQLGQRICAAFLETQAIVVGLDRDINKKNLIRINYQKVDVVREKSLLRVFEGIIKKYQKIDILINNAGVSVFESFEKRKERSFDLVMDTNLKGVFFCIKNYVKMFDQIKQKSGNIINIGSVYGIISPDYRIYTDCTRRNSEVYGATKAGVIQMTKYFAVHLAERNIRVNCISPGGIFNPLFPQGKDFIKNYSFRCPMKRMAEDSEIIGGIIYLASKSSSYVTGHNLVIDGGLSCW